MSNNLDLLLCCSINWKKTKYKGLLKCQYMNDDIARHDVPNIGNYSKENKPYVVDIICNKESL